MKIGIQLLKELILIILYPFAQAIPLPKEENPYNPKKTILFVERWFNPNPFHKVWLHFLRKKGYAVYIVNFPIFKGTFEESAEKLKTFVDEKKLTHFTLVGISAGGITSYLYLQHYNGWEKVDKFISLGAPLKGTPIAIFISFIKSGRELLPSSNVVQEIKNEEIKNPKNIYCISARFDEMVPHKRSHLHNTNQITLKSVGHNNFHLDTKKTYEEIIKIAENN